MPGKGWGQNVTVTGASGITGSPFATLSAAFAQINATAQTGNNIVITITGNTTEPVGGAVLNAGAWTTMSIQPTGGVARTISGAVTAGLPLINLNGADNVTFNGLNSGGNSLTISNTTVSSTTGTSTIQFIGDATNNTITNSSILGSSTMSVTTNGGNIFFSTSTTNGNDNNLISNCNIGPANGNLPTKGIYMSGSTTNTARNNSQNSFTNNNIYDYFGAATTSAGVYIGTGNTDNNITNNRFYQTATRTQTTGAQHSAIWVANTSGNNFQITNNSIGYSGYTSGVGSGSYNFVGVSSSSRFVPIQLSVGTTTATNASSNTIAGIAMSGPLSGTASSASPPFTGIFISGGLVTANSNTIGSMSNTENITLTSSSSLTSDFCGIFNYATSGNLTTNGNNIGGITLSNSSTGASNFYGLWYFNATVSWTCNNNTIGGNIANSILSTTTATGSIVNGIRCGSGLSSVSLSASGNIIRNLSVSGGTGTTTSASIIGICMASTGANHTLSNNQIYNLNNSNTTSSSVVTGIQFTGSTSNVVERNLIYGLTSATNSTTAEVNGIRVAGGTTTYRNNMIVLGAGISNAIGAVASNSSATGINGFNGFLGTDNFWHNSIYIGGTATAGSGASYAFNGTQISNTRSFRNNIFVNARTNSGATGIHYAVKINGTSANPTGLTINNNIYFVSGTGGIFGYFNSANRSTLSEWQTAVGQDANSYFSNPQFLDPTNATPNLNINPNVFSQANASGVDLGVTNDYDNDNRSSLTPVDIGADAYTPIVSCATYASPSDGATGVSEINTTISWNAATNATSYDVYFGTDNPPTNIINGTTNVTTTSYTHTSNLLNNQTYYWRIVPRNAVGPATGCNTVWSFTTQSPTPTLVVGALAAFGNQCQNTTSNANSFTVSGVNLTNDVNIAALAGFSYSLGLNGTYTSTLTIPASGTLNSTTVFVKFTPTTASSFSGNIVVSSTGANSQNVAASGTGLPAPTVDAGADFSLCQGESQALNGSTNATLTVGTPTSVSETGLSVTIPDGNTTTGITRTLSIANSNILANQITSVSLQINHTYNADLDIYLIAPDGTQIALSEDKGGSGDNYNCTFITGGAALSTGNVTITGNVAPQTPFSSLGSGSANGTWTLRVFDDASITSGTLIAWSINFTPNFLNLTWSPPTGLSATNILNPTCSATSTQTYTLNVTGGNGCSASDQVTVTSVTAPTAVSVSPASGNFCDNVTLTASGGTGGTIYWQNTSSNGTNASSASSSQSLSASGTYYFRAYNGTCWGAQGSATITVQSTPAAPLATATPSTICVGETSNLVGTSAGNFINWYDAPTGGTLLSSLVASGSNYAVNPTINTSYYAEAATNSSSSQIETFNYTGSNQTWTVPAGVTSINVKMWGAGGGSNSNSAAAGGGAFVTGTMAVTPGQTFNIIVGQGGAPGTNTVYGGGGAGGPASSNVGGSGGGRTAIRDNSGTEIITAAGGGGGGGQYAWNFGGGGGYTNGLPGGYWNTATTNGGGGGTLTAGGAAGLGTWANGNPGTAFTGGNASTSSSTSGGGGGGGGYFGGGSGGNGATSASGGGGGSSYTSNLFTSVNGAAGASGTNASCGAGGLAGGNTDPNYVSGIGQGANGCSTVPGGNGLLIITYTPVTAGCISTSRSPITVNVNPAPTANAGAAVAAICQGETSAPMGGSIGGTATSGSWSGGAGTWTNANDPANASYTAGASESGNITLTLTTNGGGCNPVIATKTINVKPVPVANAGSDVTICNGSSTQLNGTSNIVSEDFSGGDIPSGWSTSQTGGSPATVWYHSAIDNGGYTFNSPTASNGYMNVDSDFWGDGTYGNAYLVTPSYNFSGYSSINFSMSHYYNRWNGSEYARLEVSIDGGVSWTTLNTWTADSPNAETYSVAVPQASGQSDVKFRFNYYSDADWYWFVDDIVITGTGVTYAWTPSTALSATNIANPTANPTSTQTYSLVATLNGCSSAPDQVVVTVNPTPAITAMTASTCSGTTFSVTPVNSTNGLVPANTTYSWSAPVVTGITGAAAGTNASSISGTLTNTTNAPINVVYTVTPTTQSTPSCPGTPFTVTVTVNPRPSITNMTATICSGTSFTAAPVQGTNGTVPANTTYSWSAPSVAGITGTAAGTGATSISNTLTNTTNSTISVPYTVTPLSPAGSCSGSPFTVTVTVRPIPSATISGTTTLCQNATNPNVTFANPTNLPITVTYNVNGGTNTTINVTANGTSTVAAPTSASGTFTYNLVSVAYQTAPTCSASLSGSVTVTVNSTPVVSISRTPTGPQYNGTVINFTSSLSGGTGPYTYAWTTTPNNGNVSSSPNTGSSANFTSTVNATGNGNIAYAVIVTDINGCSSSSNTLTPTLRPNITVPTGTLTRCQGAGNDQYSTTTTMALSTATNPENGYTDFVWSLTPSTAGTISNTGVVTWDPSFSGSATVSVFARNINAIPTAGTQPSSVQSVTVSVTPTNTISLSSSNNTQTVCSGTAISNITYNTTGATGVSATGLPSGVTASFTGNVITISGTPNVPAGGTFTYTVNMTGGCTLNQQAPQGTITVTPNVTINAFSPATSSRCQGAGTVNYTTTASNSTGITYSLDATSLAAGNTIDASSGVVTYVSGWSGTTTITASAAGCNGPATTTHVVTITPTVGTPTAITVSAGTEPSCQLTNGTTTTTYATTAANSTGLNWSVSPIGAGTINSSGVMTWTNGYSGTATISVTANGCNGPSSSVTRSVTVNPNLPASISITSTATTICSGTSVTFTASPTNGGTSPTYQWKVNGTNVGTNAATYTSASLVNGDIVTCELISNASPCLSGSPATSNSITITVGSLSVATNPIANENYVWTGTTNSDWSTASNWIKWNGTSYESVAIAPTSSNNVIIPAQGGCVASQPASISGGTGDANNLTIESLASLTLSNSASNVLKVAGNWKNDGTFTANVSEVEFNGSGAQTIGGAGTNNFYRLRINNTSSTDDVSLIAPASVENMLTLSSGKLNIGNFNLNTDNSSLVGGSPASYVKTSGSGEFQHAVSSTLTTFPVGNNSYNPVELTKIAGASHSFGVRVRNQVTANGQDNGPVSTGQNVGRMWHITPANGYNAEPVTVGLIYDNAGGYFTPGFVNTNPADRNMFHYGNTWENITNSTGTFSSAPYSIANYTYCSQEGVTNFSPFTISNFGVVLPIELVSFQANCAGDDKINVTWTTASEHNTSHYVVEHSRNGNDWEALTIVAAAGNSTSLLDYTYVHENPNAGTNYYRLTQYDNDGEFEQFNAVAVDCDNLNSNTTLSTYPNPSEGSFYISLFTEEMDGAGVITITDTKGAVVHTQDVNIQKGNSVFYMNNMQVAPGMYYIKVTNRNNKTYIVKHSLR